MADLLTISDKVDAMLVKLDEILKRLGPAPSFVPESGTIKPESGTQNMTDLLYRPNAEIGAILDARVAAARDQFNPLPVEGVPTIWENRTVVAHLAPGNTYSISCPIGRGYTVAGRAGGYDARFNGVVGSATLKADGTGFIYLTVDKACEAVFVPV